VWHGVSAILSPLSDKTVMSSEFILVRCLLFERPLQGTSSIDYCPATFTEVVKYMQTILLLFMFICEFVRVRQGL
jgi:hypothetical protein